VQSGENRYDDDTDEHNYDNCSYNDNKFHHTKNYVFDYDNTTYNNYDHITLDNDKNNYNCSNYDNEK